MNTQTARLNAASAVNHFGGRANLVRLSRVHNITPAPEYEAVKKWVQRNSIPAEYLTAMTALGAALQKPFLLADHMTPTTHHKDTATHG